MAGQLGKRMTIARLRHRLVLERCLEVMDRFRGSIKEWSEVAQVRAEVVPISGRELFQNGVAQAQGSHRVSIRYRGDVRPEMRFRWLDTAPETVLNIVACPPSVGSSNLIEVTCLAEA